MPEVVGIRFHGIGKAYDFETNGLSIRQGDAVIVETVQGLELGIAGDSGHHLEPRQIRNKLKPVIRVATEEDLEQYERNLVKEKEAFIICRDKILAHKLDMSLVSAEYTFDGRKIVFYFTSDGRIDFRSLVKDLANVFKVRIELRQIGVRDEARMIGGVGICGREFCCSSFLRDFVPVSIKMAKEQGLSMNPTKISGCCGRLMCCLKYEQEAYSDARKGLPKLRAMIDTPAGRGKVIEVNTLKEEVTVILENSEDGERLRFTKEDLGIASRSCGGCRKGGHDDRDEKSERGGKRGKGRRETNEFVAKALRERSGNEKETRDDEPEALGGLVRAEAGAAVGETADVAAGAAAAASIFVAETVTATDAGIVTEIAAEAATEADAVEHIGDGAMSVEAGAIKQVSAVVSELAPGAADLGPKAGLIGSAGSYEVADGSATEDPAEKTRPRDVFDFEPSGAGAPDPQASDDEKGQGGLIGSGIDAAAAIGFRSIDDNEATSKQKPARPGWFDGEDGGTVEWPLDGEMPADLAELYGSGRRDQGRRSGSGERDKRSGRRSSGRSGSRGSRNDDRRRSSRSEGSRSGFREKSERGSRDNDRGQRNDRSRNNDRAQNKDRSRNNGRSQDQERRPKKYSRPARPGFVPGPVDMSAPPSNDQGDRSQRRRRPPADQA